MKYFFASLLVFIGCFCYGQPDLKVQTDEIAQINDLENILRSLNYSKDIEWNAEDIEGSAYLTEEFVNGVVVLDNGVKYVNIPLRYNIYNEEIEFKNRKGQVFNINNPEYIQELTIGESKFIYCAYKSKKESKKLFAEIMAEGQVSLLKHHQLKLLPPQQAQIHKEAQLPKLVKIPSQYLLRTPDGTIHFFKNEKELLKILKDKSEKIISLIDQEKLSVNKEKDLITIVEFYNGK